MRRVFGARGNLSCRLVGEISEWFSYEERMGQEGLFGTVFSWKRRA